MSFAYPLVLLALIFPILLLVFVWARHGQKVVVPFDHGKQTPGTGLKALLNLSASLPPLLLAVVVLLLAGPQRVAEPKSEKVMTNILFCLDVSGSMVSKYGDGDRYEGAMHAINSFVETRDGDSFGLTVFGSHFLHWIRLTNDPASAFEHALPFMHPRKLPQWFVGGTEIAMALDKCIDVMAEQEKGDRMVVLFSDGYSGDITGSGGERIAAKLAANEIKVFAIHVADGGIPPDLTALCNRTGGQAFSAGDPAALDAVFQDIDSMVQTEVEKVSAESMDNFKPYVIAGLSILGLMLVSHLAGVRYTPW